MAKDLTELMQIINDTFVCNEKVYWKLGILPKERWDYEIISHSSRHLSKLAGKLAGVCEAYEHGETFDEEKVKDVVLSAQATILKVASMVGMSADDILKGVPKKVGYKG